MNPPLLCESHVSEASIHPTSSTRLHFLLALDSRTCFKLILYQTRIAIVSKATKLPPLSLTDAPQNDCAHRDRLRKRKTSST